MSAELPNTSQGLRIELLGPVGARVNDRPVALRGEGLRALLALLTLARGRVVPTDRLTDELWGEDAPRRARDSLQMQVSRLRNALEQAGEKRERVAGRDGGYLLRLRSGECDLDQWEAARAAVRRQWTAGALQAARIALDDALQMWRGPPLAGVTAHVTLAAERARLEEERLRAVVEAIELDIELGRHAEVLGSLEALVLSHPFDERLVQLQMLALYRAGRQADALAAFRSARDRLVAEIGLEPGEPLRSLQRAVLLHAQELCTPRERRSSPCGGGLPAPPNRTLGRQSEVDAIVRRLRTHNVRLLTLTGPGGVGKTRVALEVGHALASDFVDGARLLPLAAVRTADEVPAATVKSLGISCVGGASPEDAIARFLVAKRFLLIVDNVEHVLEAGPFFGRLLSACPALTVLATSRAPLRLQAEERWAVAPLAPADAHALFEERALACDPEVALDGDAATAVEEICRRLDGLPLALELAAARSGLLTAAEIAERLDFALCTAAVDAPPRQRTLRATIDWSYDMLGDDEKSCFGRFAVLSGGATVRGAQTITGAGLDTLDGLVTKSLLVRLRPEGSPTRLTMLETVRAYAAERFRRDADAEGVCERHFRYFLEVAERHGSERSLDSTGRKAHIARLDADAGNLLAAFEWSLERSDGERALALLVAAGWYWLLRGPEATLKRIDRALAAPEVLRHSSLRVRALCIKVVGMRLLGGPAHPEIAAEAESLARGFGDHLLLAQALRTRSFDEGIAGRRAVAAALADEALECATAARDDWDIACALRARAAAAASAAELRERVDLAARQLSDVGNSYQLAHMLAFATCAALGMGSDEDARDFLDRAVPLARVLDDPFTWMTVRGGLGLNALVTGENDAAEDALSDELVLSRQLGMRSVAHRSLLALAAVAAARGDDERAGRLTGASVAHHYWKPPGAALGPLRDRLNDEFLQQARARAGTATWDAAMREGSALSLEDALIYALASRRS